MSLEGYETADMNILSKGLAGALAGTQKIEGPLDTARLTFATRALSDMLMAHYRQGERDPTVLQNSAVSEFVLEFTMKPDVSTASGERSGTRSGLATNESAARRPLFGTSNRIVT